MATIDLEGALDKLKEAVGNTNEINFMNTKPKLNLQEIIDLNEIDLQNTKKIIKGFVVVNHKRNQVHEYTFRSFKKESILAFEQDKEKWKTYQKKYGFKCIKCELVVQS